MLNRSNKEEGFALLDAAWQAGITTYDSAHGYGGGEVDRMLGLWMEGRGNRDEIVIIGKGAHLNRTATASLRTTLPRTWLTR